MHEDLTDDVFPPRTKSQVDVAQKLTHAIHEGHSTMPPDDDRPLLVCKPGKIESWRVFKIMSEFVEGFDLIRRYGLAATFFGSARETLAPEVYAHATALAARLAKKGFAVVTGGSSGIMQAANKGAFDAGGASVGLNIRLNTEQGYNAFLTDKFEFDHFFVRKVMLTYASEVYVYFPGGFGTLDEFFEIVTLVQTKKIRKVPIILFDSSYWTPLLDVIKNNLYEKHHTISEEDMDLYHVVDTVGEAYAYIVENVSC